MADADDRQKVEARDVYGRVIKVEGGAASMGFRFCLVAISRVRTGSSCGAAIFGNSGDRAVRIERREGRVRNEKLS